MNIFQIPSISDTQTDHIIGIIDASGSMGNVWSWLADHWNRYLPKEKTITITFDTVAAVVENNVLNKSINNHGGGGTNITKAFELFEKELEKIPNDKSVTALFISDGQDNVLSTLETRFTKLKGNSQKRLLTFLCLGVGSGFPTFISMRLRSLYHTGDQTIPAIFLIEYISESAFTNKFEQLRLHFSAYKPRKIEPAVCVLPWKEPTNEVFEQCWVLCDHDKVSIDGEEMVVGEYSLNLKGLTPLFRYWTQIINLEALSEGESVRVRAAKTLTLMEGIIEAVKAKKGIDLLSFDTDSNKLSFKEKAEQTFLKRNLERVKWYYEDIKNMAEGKTPEKLSEFEAAKKIGTGTIMGNYNQRIMSLTKITEGVFQDIKKEFAELIRIHSRALLPETSVPVSQKSVFREADFTTGLDFCSNQFDLFESFPLIGYGARVTAPTLPNDPFGIDVKLVTDQVISLSSVVKNKGSLQVTFNGSQDTVNTVIPLVTSNEDSLATLFDSKLFQLAITFNVTNNPDAIIGNAYIALLSKVFCEVYSSPDSDQKTTIMTNLFNSYSLLLKYSSDLRNYQDALLSDPFRTLINETQKPAETRLLEPVAYLAFAHLSNQSTNPVALKNILSALILLSFHNKKIKDQKFVDNYITIRFEEEEKDSEDVKKKVIAGFDSCMTLGDFRRLFKREFIGYIMQKKTVISWNFNEILKKDSDFLNIQKMWEDLYKAKLSEDQLVNFLMVAYSEINCLNYEAALEKNREEFVNSFIRIKTEEFQKNLNVKVPDPSNSKTVVISKGKSKKQKVEKTLDPAQLMILTSPFFINSQKELLEKFIEYFKKKHEEVFPLPESFVVNYSNINNQKNLIYDKETCFVRNACMSPSCPFFLKKQERISRHLSVAEGSIPPSFHFVIRNNLTKTSEEILQLFLTGEGRKVKLKDWKYDEKVYGRTVPEVLQYIDKIQKSYILIEKEKK